MAADYERLLQQSFTNIAARLSWLFTVLPIPKMSKPESSPSATWFSLLLHEQFTGHDLHGAADAEARR